MLELKGRHYENGEPVLVRVEGERIHSVVPIWPEEPVDQLPYIAPGLFDLQINGHGGKWFSDAEITPDDVRAILESHFQYGITRLCPTVVTNSFEALAAGFRAIRAACEAEPWIDRMVPGCHLEGPYISPEDGPRGAHPLEHVRPADWDEFQRLQEISGNRICLVTLAADSPGAAEFTRRACEAGVVVSIGHTAADAEQIQAVVDAGAKLSTHLGNGAHGTLRRHPNYIWDQLGESRLSASIITDGHHLPPSVIRSILRAKSVSRTIITCDAAGLAGCPPGRYRHGFADVDILESGKIVLAGQEQLLAGSAQLTDTCVAVAMEAAGVSLPEAIDMASRNPALLLGFEEIRLRRGSRADLIQFDFAGPGNRFQFRTTVAAGAIRFSSASQL